MESKTLALGILPKLICGEPKVEILDSKIYEINSKKRNISWINLLFYVLMMNV